MRCQRRHAVDAVAANPPEKPVPGPRDTNDGIDGKRGILLGLESALLARQYLQLPLHVFFDDLEMTVTFLPRLPRDHLPDTDSYV